MPLLLQSDYRASEWLGLLSVGRKRVDLSSQDYEQRFPEVLTEVRCVLKTADNDVASAGSQAEPTDGKSQIGIAGVRH